MCWPVVSQLLKPSTCPSDLLGCCPLWIEPDLGLGQLVQTTYMQPLLRGNWSLWSLNGASLTYPNGLYKFKFVSPIKSEDRIPSRKWSTKFVLILTSSNHHHTNKLFHSLSSKAHLQHPCEDKLNGLTQPNESTQPNGSWIHASNHSCTILYRIFPCSSFLLWFLD